MKEKTIKKTIKKSKCSLTHKNMLKIISHNTKNHQKMMCDNTEFLTYTNNMNKSVKAAETKKNVMQFLKK